MVSVGDYPWLVQVEAGDSDSIGVIDDTPIWSAPFGAILMEAVALRPGLRVLDVGSGLGYPLLELAARLGPSSHCTGLDPWAPALERARLKAQARGQAVTFQEGVAEAMPFEGESFDLVLSNNGLNNVSDVAKALAECFRVAAPGAQFLMTANLPETFETFYAHFEAVLEAAGHGAQIPNLRAHRVAKRMPSEWWCQLVADAGFGLATCTHHGFSWRLLDGEALFAHPAIRLSFIPPWVAAVGEDVFRTILPALTLRLNRHAQDKGGLELEIPFLCIEARKECPG